MNFISKNFRKAGIFNSIIIFIAMILEVNSMFSDISICEKAITVLVILGLLSGMYYSISGYKKDDAKYYQLFMYIYVFILLCDLMFALYFALINRNDATSSWNNVNTTTSVIKLIPLLCVTTLAFGKDLGKNKSFILAIVSFVAVLGSIIAEVLVYNDFIQYSGIYLGFLMLSCTTVVFVAGKYADKKERGTK